LTGQKESELPIHEVRHPPQSGWLDEWGRLKGGRPFYPKPGSSEILSPFDEATECISYSRIVPRPPTGLKELLGSYPDVNGYDLGIL